MGTNHLFKLVLLACVLYSTSSIAESLSKKQYAKAREMVEADYVGAIEYCDTLNWNAYDVCVAEAKGIKRVGNAELLATYRPSVKTRNLAIAARADANHEVAMTRCNDIELVDRESCWAVAKSIHDIETKDSEMN